MDQVLLEALTGYLVEHVKAPRREACVVLRRPTLLRLQPWRMRVLQPQDKERDIVDLMTALRPIMPPGFIPAEQSRQDERLTPKAPERLSGMAAPGSRCVP